MKLGYNKRKCDRCKKEWYVSTVIKCKKYEKNICMYCCRKCKYCDRSTKWQGCKYGR